MSTKKTRRYVSAYEDLAAEASESIDPQTEKTGKKLTKALVNMRAQGETDISLTQGQITDVFNLITSKDDNISLQAQELMGFDLNVLQELTKDAQTGSSTDVLAGRTLEKLLDGKEVSAFEKGKIYFALGEKLDAEVKVKYSLKDTEIPTAETLAKKKDVEVINISEPQTAGNPAQRRKQILENAKEVIKKPYLNKDTGVMIFLTSKSYTHTFSNSGELQLNIAEHLPELVENAVLTNVEEPTHGSKYTDKVYKFLAAVKGDEVMPAKLTVKEYSVKGQNLPKNIELYFSEHPEEYSSLYDAVILKVDKIEESPSGSVGPELEKVTRPNPQGLSTTKVTDLTELVNEKNKAICFGI